VLLRRLLPLSLLGVAAALLLLLLRPENVLPGAGGTTASTDTAQTYLINSLAQRFNAAGRLEEILVSPRVDYYASMAQSRVSQPKLWRFTEDGTTWQAWGDTGNVQHADEAITLQGHAVLRRANDGMELRSDEISIATQSNQAYTTTPVTIAEHGRSTTARSMTMDLRSGETRLRDQVESVYEPK